MGLLATFSLRALHIFYTLALFIYSSWKRLTGTSPQPLEATRRRIPKHLAVVLVIDPNSSEDIEKSLISTIANVVGWCRIIGTQKLTIYEEHGMEYHCKIYIWWKVTFL
jgi:dehydrodolichyl diphosphate syntase complex subunit NUS1